MAPVSKGAASLHDLRGCGLLRPTKSSTNGRCTQRLTVVQARLSHLVTAPLHRKHPIEAQDSMHNVVRTLRLHRSVSFAKNGPSDPLSQLATLSVGRQLWLTGIAASVTTAWDLKAITTVFPVIVTRDDIGSIAGVNSFLGERLRPS